MKTIYLIVALLFCNGLFSQTNLDSIQLLVEYEKEDTSKIRLMLSFMKKKGCTSPVELNTFANQALDIATKSPDKKWLLAVRHAYAKELFDLGEQAHALAQYQLLKELAKKHQNPLMQGRANLGLGICNRFLGNIDKVLVSYQEALALFKEEESKEDIASTHNQLAGFYRQKGDMNAAFENLQLALIALKEHPKSDKLVMTYNQLGRYYRTTGQLDSAKVNYERSLQIALANKDEIYAAGIYNNLGNIAQIEGDWERALAYYIKSKDLKEPLGNKRGLSISYHNIGTIRTEMKDFEMARKDFEKSSELANEIDFKIIIVHNYRRLGHLSREEGHYEEAIEQHRKALDLARVIQFQKGEEHALLNLGEDYLAAENYTKSMDYLLRGLPLMEKSGNKSLESACLVAIAEVYGKTTVEENKELPALFGSLNLTPNKIEGLLQRALALSKELKDAENKTNVYKGLQAFYTQQKAYKKNALLLNEYISFKDSLFANQRVEAIADLETKYETAEKEKEILLLEKDKELAAQKEQLLRNRNRLYSFIALSLLTLLLVGTYLFYQLRQTKQQVDSQNNQLQQLNATKDKFFGIIAHDIRSPIVALDGVGEQMEYYLEKNKPAKLQRLASRVDSTAKQLNGLLDNLLNWALLQQGVIPYHPKVLNVYDVTQNTFAMFQHNADAKGVHLKVDIDKHLKITADESAINTILRNLVSNAIKFTPTGGTISIRSELKENKVFININDTGTGMAAHQLEQLFSLQKKSELGTAGEKGTGLGLTLVKELVELNKGSISVTSEINKGTKFSVALPLAAG